MLTNKNQLIFFPADIKSYEMTGRHTYFSMGITAGYAFFLFLCLAVLYKNLAPRERSVVVDATSKFSLDDIVDEEPAGKLHTLNVYAY